MPIERKYILSLDDGNLNFDIVYFSGLLSVIPTWLYCEDIRSHELYGIIRRDKDFIFNITFESTENYTHIIWDDLGNHSVHYRLFKNEWREFLNYAKIRTRIDEKVNWIKEGF